MSSKDLTQRVIVYDDQQNQWHRVNELFDCTAHRAQVDPLSLGLLLAERVPGGELAQVRVYDGLADQASDARTHAAQQRQHRAWRARGDERLVLCLQPLDYRGERPRQRVVDTQLVADVICDLYAGNCDVAIVASEDRDLTPAREAARRIGAHAPRVLFARWTSGPFAVAALGASAVCGERLWLTAADFLEVVDWSYYGQGPAPSDVAC